jgi:hypothetical protein
MSRFVELAPRDEKWNSGKVSIWRRADKIRYHFRGNAEGLKPCVSAIGWLSPVVDTVAGMRLKNQLYPPGRGEHQLGVYGFALWRGLMMAFAARPAAAQTNTDVGAGSLAKNTYGTNVRQ